MELILSGLPNLPSPFEFSRFTLDIASTDCICATNPECTKPSAIFYNQVKINTNLLMLTYIVPGWVTACYTADSLLLSTLECFYSESDCLPTLTYYAYIATLWNTDNSLFIPRPLIYNNSISRFPPDTKLSVIFMNLMIEQWNFISSYDSYFQACSPTFCTHLNTMKTKNFAEIIITLVSIIGGLTVTLRLLTMVLIQFVHVLFRKNNRIRARGNPR